MEWIRWDWTRLDTEYDCWIELHLANFHWIRLVLIILCYLWLRETGLVWKCESHLSEINLNCIKIDGNGLNILHENNISLIGFASAGLKCSRLDERLGWVRAIFECTIGKSRMDRKWLLTAWFWMYGSFECKVIDIINFKTQFFKKWKIITCQF